jgi:aminomethyltransferase
MNRTTLGDHLTRIGARPGEYCGAETALCFTDSRREFLALRDACGVYDLDWHAPFVIGGRDRVRWLNGMVSNNIRDLALGQGNYNFLLSAQGHILGDLYIYNRGEDFLAVTEQSQLQSILATFRKYIIMDQVEVVELGGQLTGIGVQGPRAAEWLRRAGLPGTLTASPSWTETAWQGQRISLASRGGGPFQICEFWTPPAEAPGIWDALTAAGAVPTGAEALEMFRVAAGIPRVGVDIRDRELPQETAQMQALHFGKGCYIGQEIVERVRARGNVHRTFTGFVIDGALPAPGAKLLVESEGQSKEAGEITSALRVPQREDDHWATLALGYVRREHAAPGAILHAGGALAKVSPLPFSDIL